MTIASGRSMMIVAVLAVYGDFVASGHTAEKRGSLSSGDQSELATADSGIKSVDEIANELANPNNSPASLTFKNQFRWYTGHLPGADDQCNYTLLFQPSFPFSLGETANGSKVNLFLLPAIPLPVSLPTFDTRDLDFDSVTAVGEIGLDIGRGVSEKNSRIWLVGMMGRLPTATDSDDSGKELLLGPECALSKFEKWGIFGIFLSHLWNVAGWSDESVSMSQLQAIFVLLPGCGCTFGTVSIMNYDRESNGWWDSAHGPSVRRFIRKTPRWRPPPLVSWARACLERECRASRMALTSRRSNVLLEQS